MIRRLKYENTFLVVKDEVNIRRARSHSPKLTSQDLDTTPVRRREAANYYVSLLEAFLSDPGSKLPETADSPPKRGAQGPPPSQRTAGRCARAKHAVQSKANSSFQVPDVPT